MHVSRGGVESGGHRIWNAALGVRINRTAVAFGIAGGRRFPFVGRLERIPHSRGNGRIDRRAELFFTKQAGNGEGLVAEHFGSKARAGPLGKEAVIGIALGEFWATLGILTIGAGEDELAQSAF